MFKDKLRNFLSGIRKDTIVRGVPSSEPEKTPYSFGQTLTRLRQGQANPVAQGIYDLPSSIRETGRNIVPATKQILFGNPSQTADIIRSTPEYTNFKVPGLETISNFTANNAQLEGTGVQNIQAGYQRRQQPGVFNEIAGSFQMAKGIGQTVLPFVPGAGTLYNIANLTASVPGNEGSIRQRIPKGFLKGQTQIEDIAGNVQDKVMNLNTPFGDVSFDPAQVPGRFLGFTQNPVNKLLFNMTERVLPAGNAIQMAKAGQFKRWLGITGLRGSIEDIILSADRIPEDATDQEKALFMLQNAVTGAVQEIGGRFIFDTGSTGSKAIKDSKAGQFTIKQLAEAFDGLKETTRRLNVPVATHKIDPKTGKRIVVPMWQYMMQSQEGFIKPDEFVPDSIKKQASVNLSQEEVKASRLLREGVPVQDIITKYGVNPGDVSKAKQRIEGKGLLADLENAVQAKNADLVRQINDVIQKLPDTDPVGAQKSIAQKLASDMSVPEYPKGYKDISPVKSSPYSTKNINEIIGKSFVSEASGREFTPIKIEGDTAVDTGGNRVKLTNFMEGGYWKPNVAQPPIGDIQPKQTTLRKARDLELKKPSKIQGEDKIEGGTPSSNDSLINEARKQIGSKNIKSSTSVSEHFNNFYTQLVDRYAPIVNASKKAQEALGDTAVLRPESDPTYAVRRLTGAAGIADYRYRTELEPVLKEIKPADIDPKDMDVYLANKRMAGFGKAGRDIYGTDPVKSQKIVDALDVKYGAKVAGIADKIYTFQDTGLDSLAKSGFFTQKDIDAMRSQNPDYSPLFRVMDEVDDYLGLPTRKTMQGTSPIKKIKGSERNIQSPLESIVGNIYKQQAAIEKNNVARQIVGLQKITDMGFEKVQKSGNDTITVWQNGKKEYWRVGADIAETAKGANEENMNLVLKILQKPAALLRQGATGRNPSFMIPNVVRDQLDAGITSKYGYIPFVDYVSGLRSILTNDEAYQKWQQSGAKIDLGELSGERTVKQAIGEKVAKRNLFSFISDALDVMGKYSEQPTRVGLFKRALEKTGNENLAMLESRDATVDFARMGTKMKVANSIIPFLNVSVQGFDKIIRSSKDHPGRTLLNMGMYAVAPALMTTLYNLTYHPQEYSEVPEYDKNDNFVLISGRNPNGTVNYVTIPKGNVIPIVTNPIQSFLEYYYNIDNADFKSTALKTFSEVLPVLGEGGTLKEIGIKTIGQNIPQAIKPPAENLLNRSFYKYDDKKAEAREIVPYYLKDKPAYQQDYEFTPQMYKKIGAVLNVSPLQIKNLMEGYLAGYTKAPAQIIDTLYNISRGKQVSPNEIPIAYRFVKQTYESGNTSGVKKQETPKAPGLFDRVLGKASASEESPVSIPKDEKEREELYKSLNTTLKGYTGKRVRNQYSGKDEADIQSKFEKDRDEFVKAATLKREIENQYPDIKKIQKSTAEVKDLMERGKLPDIYHDKENKKVFYKEGDTIKSFTINDLPPSPKQGNNEELNKKLRSAYYGKITAYVNDIVKMYELGIISEQEAEQAIDKAETAKNTVSGGSGGGSGRKALKGSSFLTNGLKLTTTRSAPRTIARTSRTNQSPIRNFQVKTLKAPKLRKLTFKN